MALIATVQSWAVAPTIAQITIGETTTKYYDVDELQTAVSELTGTATVTLEMDFNGKLLFKNTTDVTLDLNSCTITGYVAFYNGKGTINDNGGNGAIVAKEMCNALTVNGENVEVVINGGAMSSEYASTVNIFYDSSKVLVRGGSFHSDEDQLFGYNGEYLLDAGYALVSEVAGGEDEVIYNDLTDCKRRNGRVEYTGIIVPRSVIATIGTREYYKVSKFCNDVVEVTGDEVTVTLHSDIEYDLYFMRNTADIIFDLNGHILTGTINCWNKTLLVKDSSTGKSGKVIGRVEMESDELLTVDGITIESENYQPIYVSSGKVILNNVTASSKNNKAIEFAGKEMTINGGTYTSQQYSALYVNGSSAKITINGGTFTSGGTYSGSIEITNATSINISNATVTGSIGIKDNSSSAALDIKDCTVNATTSALYLRGGGQATITGGTYTSEGSDYYDAALYGECASITINSGTFTNENQYGLFLRNDGTKKVINGGTFTGKQAGAMLENGECTINNGTFTGETYGLRASRCNSVTVNEATFTANIGLFVEGSSVTLNGGVFDGQANAIALKSWNNVPEIIFGEGKVFKTADNTILDAITEDVAGSGRVVDANATSIDRINADKAGKAIKTVENGKVVIIRDGDKYDLAGRKL